MLPAVMTPEWWLNEADRLLADDRRAESAIAIATALECTLGSCIRALLVGSLGQQRALPAEVEMLHKRYMNAIGKMPLVALQKLTIQLVIRGVRPKTIPQALEVIEHARRYASRLPPGEHFAIDDAARRAAIEALRDAEIVELRSAVVHRAYIPTPEEIAEQRRVTADLIGAISAAFTS